jgi:amino acid permease
MRLSFFFLNPKQDTLKSPPPESETTQRGNVIAVVTTTLFYLCVGCFGYAAFGNAAPGNLLTGFGFYEPYWLVGFANACIVLHLLGGYQVLVVSCKSRECQFRNLMAIARYGSF